MAGPIPVNSTLVMSIAAGVGLGIGLVIVKMAADFISEKTGTKIPTYYARSYVGYDDVNTIPVEASY